MPSSVAAHAPGTVVARVHWLTGSDILVLGASTSGNAVSCSETSLELEAAVSVSNNSTRRPSTVEGAPEGTRHDATVAREVEAASAVLVHLPTDLGVSGAAVDGAVGDHRGATGLGLADHGSGLSRRLGAVPA